MPWAIVPHLPSSHPRLLLLSQPPLAQFQPLHRLRHRLPLRTTRSSLVVQGFWPSSPQISPHSPATPSPLSSTRRITLPRSPASLRLVKCSDPLPQAVRLASTLGCTWWRHYRSFVHHADFPFYLFRQHARRCGRHIVPHIHHPGKRHHSDLGVLPSDRSLWPGHGLCCECR